MPYYLAGYALAQSSWHWRLTTDWNYMKIKVKLLLLCALSKWGFEHSFVILPCLPKVDRPKPKYQKDENKGQMCLCAQLTILLPLYVPARVSGGVEEDTCVFPSPGYSLGDKQTRRMPSLTLCEKEDRWQNCLGNFLAPGRVVCLPFPLFWLWGLPTFMQQFEFNTFILK